MYQVMGIGNIVIGKMSIEKTVVGNKSRRPKNGFLNDFFGF